MKISLSLHLISPVKLLGKLLILSNLFSMHLSEGSSSISIKLSPSSSTYFSNTLFSEILNRWFGIASNNSLEIIIPSTLSSNLLAKVVFMSELSDSTLSIALYLNFVFVKFDSLIIACLNYTS